MTRVIEIIVSPQGKLTVQTKGFAGSSCQEASKALEQALGAAVNDQHTPEYFATPVRRRIDVSEGYCNVILCLLGPVTMAPAEHRLQSPSPAATAVWPHSGNSCVPRPPPIELW